jgi:uncharacterized protein YutE (UPF0331/DUF86 family)
VVDEERVTRLAGEALADVARLRQLAATPDLVHQPDQLDAVKYRFVTAIERCVGIAHHVIASEGWSAPETNSEAMRELGHRGVVDDESATSLARASGFRNLLVHQYGDIDDQRVVEFLDRLPDLERFVRQVLTWVDSQS